MKRKIIAFLLSALMTAVVVSVTATTANAQQDFAIAVSSEKVKKGTDSVTLDVFLQNNPGIAGITMTLEFDNTALAVKSVTEGDFSKLALVTGDGNQSPYKIVSVNFAGSNVTGDGKLFSVTFDILDGAEVGTYDVTVNSNSSEDKLFVIDQNGANVSHITLNGSVSVVSGKTGGGIGGGTVTDGKDDQDGNIDGTEKTGEGNEVGDVGDGSDEGNEGNEEGEVSQEKWINPFLDVKEDDWFYAYVEYAVKKGLFNGVSEGEFAPFSNLTRAMLVTVLYRAEGEPQTTQNAGFSDVPDGAYYAKAVDWAKHNGIVNGMTETEFAPNVSITREQIAAIMFRYAVFKGMTAVTLEENLGFDDADQISEYAVSALNWAVGSGLMNGRTETTLNPKDTATRAEAATILTRYFSEIAQ